MAIESPDCAAVAKLRRTLKSRELATPTSKAPVTPFDPMHRLELFRLSPSLVTAAEAVETAMISGREGDAVDAARRIVNIDANAAPLICEQAAALLRRAGQGGDVPPMFARRPSRMPP